MNKKIRNNISLVVVVCLAIIGLFLCFRIPDYLHAKQFVADATGDPTPDWTLVETVRKDFALIDKIGFSGDVEDMRIGEDGTITYISPISDDLVDEIIIYKDEDGNIVEEIWEGDLYNKMILTPSGELFLDGTLIE